MFQVCLTTNALIGIHYEVNNSVRLTMEFFRIRDKQQTQTNSNANLDCVHASAIAILCYQFNLTTCANLVVIKSFVILLTTRFGKRYHF